MKTLFATAATLALLSVAPVSASTVSNAFTVDANDHVWNGGNGFNGNVGLATGIALGAGDMFSVSVDDTDDTWLFCGNTVDCTINADGLRVLQTPPTLFNSGTPYTNSGFSENNGALVGRVAGGDFFEIGTAGFSGAADATGELFLYHWDWNTNNSGTLAVTVTSPAPAVPLPAGLPLLAAGLGVFAIAGRRASKSNKG